MRLGDKLFRGGHLADEAIIESIVAGTRPDHLDRCDICLTRAADLGRWLDSVRTTADEAADAAFPAPKLAVQRAQILRKLEQIDYAPRVISFPAAAAPVRGSSGRRIAPAWLGVAAAAGLVVGVISGQMTARVSVALPAAPAAGTATPSTTLPADLAETESTPAVASVSPTQYPELFDEVDRPTVSSTEALAGMTPRQATFQLASLRIPNKR